MHGWSAEFVFLIISECKLCWWNGVPTQLWLWSFDKLTVRCARMLGSGDCRFGDMGNWTDWYSRAKLVVQYPWSGEPSTSNQASCPSSWKTATLHCSHWASYCVWQFGGKLTVMGSTVLFVDADSVQEQLVSKGSLQKMALSQMMQTFWLGFCTTVIWFSTLSSPRYCPSCPQKSDTWNWSLLSCIWVEYGLRFRFSNDSCSEELCDLLSVWTKLNSSQYCCLSSHYDVGLIVCCCTGEKCSL